MYSYLMFIAFVERIFFIFVAFERAVRAPLRKYVFYVGTYTYIRKLSLICNCLLN